MSMRQKPPSDPWKVLLLGLAACALIFLLTVSGAAYWFLSHTRQQSQLPMRGEEAPDLSQLAHEAAIESSTPSTNRAPVLGPKRTSFPSQRNGSILALKHGEPEALPGDDLFLGGVIPAVHIKLSPEAVASLNRDEREYVPATMQEGDRIYTNVAIHLKGGIGSKRPLNDRPALTLNFDKFAPGQTFHGLKKIHLNNSVQDQSYLEEKICRELFEVAGVPVPRAGHAHVTLNGRRLGLYVLLEGVNKPFLKRYFSDVKGDVYDGYPGADVTQNLPINSGDEDRSRLKDLARFAGIRNLDRRLEALEETLDVERFLSFMAMEMILWHWDGYTMSRNNFRVFHDRAANKMVFIPKGVDQMLNKPAGPVFPQTPSGLVARSVLEIPELRERYEDKLAELATNVFQVEAITTRIDEVAQNIQRVLAITNPEEVAQHRSRAARFAGRIERRAQYLQRHIFRQPEIQLEPGSSAPLSNWWTNIDLGEARLEQQADADGRRILQIATANGCTASWRTAILLDRGSYGFSARLRTKGVVLAKEERAGAGLRISGHRNGQKNSGDLDWTPVRFDFNVEQDDTEIVLVCELRALEGEVCFDLDSLTLTRE